MPTFQIIDRRLVLRYSTGSAFSFCKLNRNAEDQGVYELANAVASVQDSQPAKIVVAVTQQLR